MVNGIAGIGAKALGGARFSLVNLMPASFVAAFAIFLFSSGVYTKSRPEPEKAIDAITGSTGNAVLAVFGIFVLAVLLRPFQATLVHILEGYWEVWPSKFLVDPATERHRRIRHTAKVIIEAEPGPTSSPGRSLRDVVSHGQVTKRSETIIAKAEAIYARYPEPKFTTNEDGTRIDDYDDRLMPTVLGNILRDGEDNAGDRYGLDFTVVSQHLYPHLSPKIDAALKQSLDLIDVTAAMCVSFAVTAALSSPLLGRWDMWSLIPVLVAGLSALAYWGATRMARSHTRLLATAVDLHRFDMIASLRYPLPTTTADEYRLNEALSGFLDSRGRAHDFMSGFRYVHPTEPPETPQLESEAEEAN